MLWEKFEDHLIGKKIGIKKNSKVIGVEKVDDHFNIEVLSSETKEIINAKHIMFSNPLLQFIKFYKENVPKEVLLATEKLSYRNHISVHLTIDQKLFDDNWIYIHSPESENGKNRRFHKFF
jgi:hypothetical protein